MYFLPDKSSISKDYTGGKVEIYIIPKIVNILVVLIGLVVIFKEQLVSLVKSILSKITEQSNSI